MPKARPEKKRQKPKPVQPQFPGMPPPLSRGTVRIFPTQLQIGDRMTDSTGEWEVVGRPYTTAGGKNAHVRVQRVKQPGVTGRSDHSTALCETVLAGEWRSWPGHRDLRGSSAQAHGHPRVLRRQHNGSAVSAAPGPL